jgi:thymidylate kinase
MIIIEGIRRSGKSFIINALQKHYPDLIYHKDLGIRMIKDTPIDVDDYVIGRDLAFAQFLPKIETSNIDCLILDRQYWSAYVYGQFYRNKYDKAFWRDHIEKVEQTYGINWTRKNLNVVLLSPEPEDYKRLASMGREKDHLEDSDINSYLQQQSLYLEILEFTRAQVHLLKPFQTEEYIIDFMRPLIPSLR